MPDVLLITDERMREHVAGDGHVERPERLDAVLDALHATPLPDCRWGSPAALPAEALGAVHTPDHLERLAAVAGTHARLDPDTAVSPPSVDAAQLAAGAGIAAVDALIDGTAHRAFALVRPPGHHAEADRAMGFCLYNNVAVAAEHARRRGCERVLIVDWDVHHGNGTQHHFEDRSDVLFFSAHRFPFYPGTGAAHETGHGAGEGHTVNVPMPPGMGDADFAHLFERLLVPIAEAYNPELVLVSAGFDAHADDLLGDQQVTDDGFAHLCGIVQGIADRCAQGRIALLLEGGYDLGGLARSAVACTRVLAGHKPPEVGGAGGFAEGLADALVGLQCRHWEVLR